jgi:hypothetical protein
MVPRSTLGVAARVSEYLPGDKTFTYVVTPKGVTVENVVRYKGSSWDRVVSYDIVKDGKKIGYYKADIREKVGSVFTEIVSEETVVEDTSYKPVVLDLFAKKNLSSSVGYQSEVTGDQVIQMKEAKGIFQAKNDLQSTPRSKDIMDFNMQFYADILTNMNSCKDNK